MGDVICAKCGEPYEYYHVMHDMEPEERRRFLAREGCDACNYGQSCTQCGGTGIARTQSFRWASPACPHCRDQHYIFLRRRVYEDGATEPANDLWAYGYQPDYHEVPLEGKEIMRVLPDEHVPGDAQHRGFITQQVKVRCWHPHEHTEPCPACQGTGKLRPISNGEQLSLWSLFEETDLDPIDFL